MKIISVNFLHPHKDNIRKEFDKKSLQQLSSSIARIGIVQPIIMLKDGTIVTGHRRWMAAKMPPANYKEFVVGRDVLVIKKPKKELDVINAAENMARQNLNIFEEADGLMRICKLHVHPRPEACETIARYIQTHTSNPNPNEDEYSKQGRENMKEIINMLGITENRACSLLALHKITPETKKYALSNDKMFPQKLTLSQLYQISRVKKEDQLDLAKHVRHRRIPFERIPTHYKEWKEGTRDKNTWEWIGKNTQQKRRKKEIIVAEQTIHARDVIVDKLRTEQTNLKKEHKFSWSTLSVDITMMLNDIPHMPMEEDTPRGFMEKVSELIKQLKELQKKLRDIKYR